MRVKFKQGMAFAMSSVMALAIAQAAGAEAAASEPIPAWVSAEIADWKQLGLVKGDQQGFVHPSQAVTKAEFVAFVNRVFGFTDASSQTFGDVPATAWYAPEIAKAVAAGALIGGEDGKMGPLETLTREKAAIILSRIFQVPAAPSSGVAAFADDAGISSWAKDAVYALKNAGYLAGDASGAFQPQKALTRGEAIKMINNAMGKLVNDSETHADLNGANLVVNAAGGTLSQLNLSGNLYITPGVGEGELTIEGSQIAGTIYVQGGGEHSIVLKDTKAKHVVIDKRKGAVRVLLSGDSRVESVTAASGGTLDNATSNAVGSVTVAAGADATVSVSGPIASLTLQSGATLNVGAADIEKLTAANTATGGKIQLGSTATVGNFTAESGVTVSGDGEIANATINASGVTLAMKPGHLVLNADSANVGGEVVKKDSVSPDENAGTEAGGGGGGGGTPSRDLTTKLYTYAEAQAGLSDNGAEGQVKQYLGFLGDSTYKPSVANPSVPMGSGVNSRTFVNYEFTVKPSIFASMPGVNTSVLIGNYLWIGTDTGLTKVNVKNGIAKEYTVANSDLKDAKVLLLIADGDSSYPGVFAITETGVAHIHK